MTTDLDPLNIRRILGRGQWSVPQPYGDDSWVFTHRAGDGTVIASVCPGWMVGDPHDWLHASMTRRDRTPSYEDLCLLRAAVFGNGWAYQVFAPTAAHVNIHVNALHLWGRADGQPALPDFGQHGTI